MRSFVLTIALALFSLSSFALNEVKIEKEGMYLLSAQALDFCSPAEYSLYPAERTQNFDQPELGPEFLIKAQRIVHTDVFQATVCQMGMNRAYGIVYVTGPITLKVDLPFAAEVNVVEVENYE